MVVKKREEIDFKKSSVEFYWITPGKSGTSIEVGYTYSQKNGQIASAKTIFYVLGPSSGSIETKLNEVSIDHCLENQIVSKPPVLELGRKACQFSLEFTSKPGITFQGLTNFDNPAYPPPPGTIYWVQVAGSELRRKSKTGSNLCKLSYPRLDGGLPYPADTDTPGLTLDDNYQEMSTSMKSRRYLMWIDRTDKTKIPVPLGYVDWNWSGTAVYDTVSKKWILKDSDKGVSDYVTSLEYPIWDGVMDAKQYSCINATK
jgi:hypothetical protein